MYPILQDVWTAMSTEPFSFGIGAIFGYLAHGRYKIVREKVNGNGGNEKESPNGRK